MTSNPINVVAAVIQQGDRYLMTQRTADNGHLASYWEFPGGKIEPGESPEESLVRELREELAIETAVKDEMLSVTHTYPEKTVHIRFFRAHITRGVPRPVECSDLRWVTPSEMHALDVPEADRPLLALLSESSGGVSLG